MLFYRCVDAAFNLYLILIFVDIFATWIPEFNESKTVHRVRTLTQPYLAFFRERIPPIGILDLSPMVAIILFQVIKRLVLYILF